MNVNQRNGIWWITAIFMISNIVTLLGQRKVEFKIIAGDDSGAEVTMVAGIDERATDSLDLKLGEQFLPGHPPAPSPIHAALLVENLLSYRNYRRIPETNKFSLEYTINVNDYSERKSPFFFKWEYPFPQYVDSARIMDRLGGTIYSFALDDTRKSIMITNEGLRNYNLVIWYSLPPVKVEEEFDKHEDDITLRYNEESISIHSNVPVYMSIFDAMSNVIWKNDKPLTVEHLNTSSLANGVYFVLCRQLDGNIQSKKIHIAR